MFTFNPIINKPANGRKAFEYVQRRLTEIENINKALIKRIGQLKEARPSGNNGKFKVKQPKTYNKKVLI